MRQVMFAAALVLTGAGAAADDAQPAPPGARPATQPALQPGGAVPGQPGRPIQISAAQVTKLEEEFELAEAARDVKRAYVKAAEVGVRVTETTFVRLKGFADKGVGDLSAAEKAKLDVELAKAQVEIRMAELKESEVKVKFAKKRLDEAKAAGVRPVPPPPVRPVPVDPVPNVRAADDKAVQQLKAQLAKVQVEIEKNADDLKGAEEGKELAEKRVEILQKQAQLGIVSRADLDDAEANVKTFKERAEKFQTEGHKLKDQSILLQEKLKKQGGS